MGKKLNNIKVHGVDFQEILNAGVKKKASAVPKKNEHVAILDPDMNMKPAVPRNRLDFQAPKKEKDDLDFDLGFTGRIWQGEHWDKKTQTFILKEGHWWNPEHKRVVETDLHGRQHIKYIGGWEKGTPRLSYFYWFYEFVFNPDKYAIPNYLGKTHKDWAEKVAVGKRNLFLCPRDHFKTTFLNVGYALYNICENPKLASMGILMIAWDNELSFEIFDEIKENLNDNERILNFYGYLIDEDRKNNQWRIYFTYSPSGARYGLKHTTFKSGSITGGHPQLIFADDIEDEPLSEKFMKKFKKVFLKKLIPAMGVHGRIIVTGTIKGSSVEDDCYLLLEKNPFWFTHTYPAANDMPPMNQIEWELKTRPAVDPITGKVVINISTGKKVMEPYIDVSVKDRDQYTTIFPERYQIEDLVRKRLEYQFFDKKKIDADFWSEYFLQARDPKGRHFNADRLGTLPPPEYATFKSFKYHLGENSIPIYAWIDPGGKGRHGIAMALVAHEVNYEGTFERNRHYILDLKVCRQGIIQAAHQLANWIINWGLRTWGAEGNFNQNETYGEVIDRELYRVLKEMGKEGLHIPDAGKSNMRNKILRIDTEFTLMLGEEHMPIQCWINTNAQDYEQFTKEMGDFPEVPKGKTHEFDLMDCVTSVKINLYGEGDLWWHGGETGKTGIEQFDGFY